MIDGGLRENAAVLARKHLIGAPLSGGGPSNQTVNIPGTHVRLLSRPSWLSVNTLRIDPRWDPIRTQPRFKALLARYAGR